MAQWVKNPFAMQDDRRHVFGPWIRKIPWRRKWQPTPVFLPEKSHGQRSLAGHSPCGQELDLTLMTKPPPCSMKSDRERQISCDFIYMWNLKNKTETDS